MTNDVSTYIYIPTNSVTHTHLSTMEIKCQMAIHKDKQTIAQETCFSRRTETCSVTPHALHHYRNTEAAQHPLRDGFISHQMHKWRPHHQIIFNSQEDVFLYFDGARQPPRLYLAGGTSTDPSQSSTRLSSIITAVNSPTLVKSPKSLGLLPANLYGVTFDVTEYIFFLCNYDVCQVQTLLERNRSLQRCLKASFTQKYLMFINIIFFWLCNLIIYIYIYIIYIYI